MSPLSSPETQRLVRLLEQDAGAVPAIMELHRALPSTNDRLRDLAAQGAPEWSLVLAGCQTAGRGRRGRTWVSPAGNLYLSVLLRPDPAVVSLTLIPLAAAVSVHEALASLGVAALLKWPNDVVVGGRKLAGVLAEASTEARGTTFVVLGCGVNLTVAPAGVDATSVAAESGSGSDPLVMAARIVGRLRVWYHALTREGGPAILDAFRQRSVPWWGEEVEVCFGGAACRGIALGVDADGGLQLRQPDGSTMSVHSGEAWTLRRGSS